jgi:hypothetical protein
MGRAWVLALGVSFILVACGGGAQHTGAGGASSGGSAGTSAAGAANGGSGDTAGTMSSTSGAGGATAAPIAVADLCPIFTADLCQYLMECAGERYRDAAQCQQELDCFGLPQLLDADQKGLVAYDPAQVGACHARFTASPCTFGAFLTTPDIYEVLSFCPGAVTPKQVAGGACSSSGECSAGLYCNKGANYTCPGTCEPFGTEGSACIGSARCADGLTCTDQKCVPTQKAGDACTNFCGYSVTCPSDQICPENIWCDPNLKQCEPGRMVGEACGDMNDAGNTYVANCAVNLWCNGLAFGPGTCEAPGDVGAPCVPDFSACKQGLHCINFQTLAPNAAYGTCSPPSGAGTDCVGDKDCQSGLVCVAGKCATPLASGAACTSDDECAAGLVCQSDKCQPALYPGAACGPSLPCAFSRCVAGTCQAYAKVGAACSLDADCATNHCVSGKCYDSSICQLPPATP